MFSNYLKTALRGFLRHRVYSLINLAGLSVALACSFLILLWVDSELSVNGFHEDGDRIYQVMRNHQSTTRMYTWGSLPKPTADVIDTDVPDITNTVLCSWTMRPAFITDKGDAFRRGGHFVSDDFLQVFTFPLLKGDAETALASPDNIVISTSMAERIFGTDWSSQEILGKTISYDHRKDFTITGIFPYPTTQSSLRFHWLINVQEFLTRRPALERWGNSGMRLFVKLRDGADRDKVNAAIRDIVSAHQEQKRTTLWLHALKDVYLRSQYENGVIIGGRIDYVRIFSVVALSILLIAGINYTNLATARASTRAREIGVRKAVGANRTALLRQFMGESLLLTAAAGVVGFGLLQASVGYFNETMGKDVAFSVLDVRVTCAYLATCLVAGLLGGAYPALYLAGFHPIEALRGSGRQKPGSGRFRQGLVVFQFAWSIVLVIGTLTVYDQLTYIQTRNIGLDRENLLHAQLPVSTQKQFDAFKAELLKHPQFISVSRSNQNPLNVGNSTWDPKWEGKDPDTQYTIKIIKADYDYAETMKLELVSGRTFDPALDDTLSEDMSFLVNEVMAATMGMEDPIGQEIRMWGDTGTVVGVVRDFHINSVHREIGPLIIRLEKESIWRLDARIVAGKEKQALEALEDLHDRFTPEDPFAARFVSEDFDRMYRSESRLGTLIVAFAVLAGFISCLGLYGLASFAVAQRTKEIGVRKVLGASVTRLIGLLSRDFMAVVVIAFVIAAPIAHHVMSDWLSGFADRVDLSWTVFAVGGATALAIAWLTIITQALRVARTNPTETLRTE